MTAARDEKRMLDQAIAWHFALASADADWDGYVRWLEADPRHRTVFDDIALIDRSIDDNALALARSGFAAPEPPATGRRRWLGGAIAAALVAAVAASFLTPGPADVVHATAAGESQRLALGRDGAVDLGPSSRLVLLGGDPQALELTRGEALFTIVHDPARILRIRAGRYEVTDIGTTFGIHLVPDGVAVAVAEGNVVVAGRDRRTGRRVAAGQRLSLGDGANDRMTPVAPDDVGSWRRGRLVYDDAPLTLVAADLARYSGRRVAVDPAISGRRFSGVVQVGDGSRLFRDVSDLMGVAYRAEGDGIRFTAGPAG